MSYFSNFGSLLNLVSGQLATHIGHLERENESFETNENQDGVNLKDSTNKNERELKKHSEIYEELKKMDSFYISDMMEEEKKKVLEFRAFIGIKTLERVQKLSKQLATAHVDNPLAYVYKEEEGDKDLSVGQLFYDWNRFDNHGLVVHLLKLADGDARLPVFDLFCKSLKEVALSNFNQAETATDTEKIKTVEVLTGSWFGINCTKVCFHSADRLYLAFGLGLLAACNYCGILFFKRKIWIPSPPVSGGYVLAFVLTMGLSIDCIWTIQYC